MLLPIRISPLLKENKVWLGYGFKGNVAFFKSPYKDTAKSTQHKEGLIRVSGVMWFTNLDIPKRYEQLDLFKPYIPEKYPKYDNYDAIEVEKVSEMPCDYEGTMGVPITFLTKYNPDQFELIKFRKGEDEKDLCYRLSDGTEKTPYFRILVKNKHPEEPLGA